MTTQHNREAIADGANPLGLDGIEYIEYATSKPQALGQVLEMMGFRPIARHRSREVTLYHQGRMNIIVNAHVSVLPRAAQPAETPVISALALRVRSAAAAYRHVIEQGAWAAPTRVEVMELNIPAIHGAGDSRIYFVDRYQDFSIYDVDFTLIPTVDPYRPRLRECVFSASCNTSARIEWKIGRSFIRGSLLFGRCLTANASAFCPKAASCAVHAVCFTCN